MLALALLFPAVWSRACSHGHAWLIAIAYFAMVTRGIPGGAAVFFGETAPSGAGWVLWMTFNAVLALPWGWLWSPHLVAHYPAAWWRTSLAMVLLILPPLGLFGFGHPLTAAGVLFPSLGWFGLCLTWLLLPFHQSPARLILLLLLIGSAFARPVTPLRDERWRALDTAYPRLQTTSPDFMEDFARQQELRRQAAQLDAPFLVMPEGVAGRWSPIAAGGWAPFERYLTSRGQTLLMGAEIPQASGSYLNAIVVLGRHAQAPLPQRVPVPISMWQPWHAGGAQANWFASGVAQFGTTRVAYLICYEQFILGPMLVSFAQGPEVIMAIANDWWARETPIPGQQRAIMAAWSALFGLPLVQSVNQ